MTTTHQKPTLLWKCWRPRAMVAFALTIALLPPGSARAAAYPIKAFCIDFNWGEGGPNGFAKPGLWADASPEEHVAWYAGLGCNVIQTFAVSCNGYAWYKGGIVPPQPGLKYDFLADTVRLGHSRGMNVMGYFCVGANTLWGPFPGKEKITPERELEFRRLAIDRCWERIRTATKRVNPDAVIWLSCCNVRSPVVVNSKLFKEVDWLMNEATDPKSLRQVAAMKGPHTRLVQCVVGWGDAHDARRILLSGAADQLGIYGFAKPGPNSLPLPVAVYRRRSVESFQGNDRNIAVLARYFTGEPLETLVPQEPDGSIKLLPGTATLHGNSPVATDNQIGHWDNPADWVYWVIDLKQPGRFEVKIEYACDQGLDGSTFTLKAGDGSFELVSKATGSWRNYRPITIGEVKMSAAGRQYVTVMPSNKTPWKAISLKSLTLTPLP
ncbi:MAG: hypothetical protein NT154_48500 [Verrucomicrobia bacterium]|nr:hypothetical protein [Verrucomicrobiota bacterium]